MSHSNPDATALVLRESDEWLAVATQFVHLKETPSLCMIASSDSTKPRRSWPRRICHHVALSRSRTDEYFLLKVSEGGWLVLVCKTCSC